MKRFPICLLLISFLVTSPALFADQKVKKRMSFGEQGFDSTSYIKGQRSRDEMNMGPMQMITIHQCDTGKVITLNDRTKTYMVMTEQQPSAPAPAPTAAARPGAKAAAPPPEPEEPADNTPGRSGGMVTINTSVQDTGEKKDFFGFPARRIKMTMSMESSPDACNPGSMKMSSDGWYINFEPGVQSCERPERQAISGGPMGRPSKPGCQDRIKYTGSGIMAMARLGYGVDVTTTMADKNGKETSFRQQALEISKATLDPGLFEPPAGYREVHSYAEMMGMGSLGGMLGAATAAANNSARMNVQRAPAPTPEVRPKQPGKLRIGVVALGNKTGQAAFDGSALRPQLIQALERFDYDVIAVDGGDDGSAMADAKRKDCDYVLFTDVSAKEASQKRKAGGMFGKALAIGVLGSAGASVPTGPAFDGTVAYRLFKIDADKPELEGQSDAKGNPQQSIPATFDKESRDVAGQIQRDPR